MAPCRRYKYCTGDVVEHKKGGKYIVEGYGMDCDNLNVLICYRSLSTGMLWVRSAEEFEQEERFWKIGRNCLENVYNAVA